MTIEITETTHTETFMGAIYAPDVYEIDGDTLTYRRRGTTNYDRDNQHIRGIFGATEEDVRSLMKNTDMNLFRMVQVVITVPNNVTFDVRGENDTTEGRGGTHHVGTFSNFLAAYTVNHGRGVMGQDGNIMMNIGNTKRIFDTAEEFRAEKDTARVADEKVDFYSQYFGLNAKYVTLRPLVARYVPRHGA